MSEEHSPISTLAPQSPTSALPNTVYLTEVKQEIMIPQAFDVNPEYVDMFQRQVKREKLMHKTGLFHDDADAAKERTEMLQAQKQKRLLDEQTRRRLEEERYTRMLKLQQLKQEEEAEAERIKTQRKHQMLLNKISFNIPDAQLYYKDKPVQPGPLFFQYLLISPKMRKGLKVNIPDMLIIADDVYWAQTDKKSGEVKIQTDFNMLQFYRTLEARRQNKNNQEIAAVWRAATADVLSFSFRPLNWNELADKVLRSTLPSSSVIFQHVRNPSERPQLTRIFYINTTRNTRASYGYTISNTPEAMKRFKLAKFIIQVDMVNGLEVYPISTGAVKQYAPLCQQVIHHLEGAYKIRIDEIVLDFTRDENGTVYLIGCEGIKLDKAALMAQQVRANEESHKTWTEIMKLRNERRDTRLSAMHCKMCLLPFKSFELENVLPFKMLLLYKQHTDRSGRNLLDLSHLRVMAVDFLSHWVRVCKLCYMLILAEYELIEVETKLAVIMNVPVKPQDVMARPSFEHPAFMPDHMNQWRVFFYFQAIKFDSKRLMKMKNLYLQHTFADKHYSYKLEAQAAEDNYAQYNITRLYYFFAQKDRKIHNLCNNLAMELRLNDSSEWGSFISKTELNPLKYFSGNMEDHMAYMQPIQVIFFNKQDKQMLKLKMVVGFSCDALIHAKSLPIGIRRYMGVYFPEEGYFNSDPFPDEWMEIFQDDYQAIERTRIVDTSQEFEEFYSPRLDTHEIITAPLGSTRVLHLNYDLQPQFGKTERSSLHSVDEQSNQIVESSKTSSQREKKPLHLRKGSSPGSSHRSPGFSTSASINTTCKVIIPRVSHRQLGLPAFLTQRPQTAPSHSAKPSKFEVIQMGVTRETNEKTEISSEEVKRKIQMFLEERKQGHSAQISSITSIPTQPSPERPKRSAPDLKLLKSPKHTQSSKHLTKKRKTRTLKALSSPINKKLNLVDMYDSENRSKYVEKFKKNIVGHKRLLQERSFQNHIKMESDVQTQVQTQHKQLQRELVHQNNLIDITVDLMSIYRRRETAKVREVGAKEIIERHNSAAQTITRLILEETELLYNKSGSNLQLYINKLLEITRKKY